MERSVQESRLWAWLFEKVDVVLLLCRRGRVGGVSADVIAPMLCSDELVRLHDAASPVQKHLLREVREALATIRKQSVISAVFFDDDWTDERTAEHRAIVGDLESACRDLRRSVYGGNLSTEAEAAFCAFYMEEIHGVHRDCNDDWRAWWRQLIMDRLESVPIDDERFAASEAGSIHESHLLLIAKKAGVDGGAFEGKPLARLIRIAAGREREQPDRRNGQPPGKKQRSAARRIPPREFAKPGDAIPEAFCTAGQPNGPVIFRTMTAIWLMFRSNGQPVGRSTNLLELHNDKCFIVKINNRAFEVYFPTAAAAEKHGFKLSPENDSER